MAICFKEATAKRFNIKINPPHVSKSKYIATIENIDTNEVRMGLNCVKGVGETSVEEILKAQKDGEFTSIQDFYSRVESKGRNKKNVEACISIGAFEGIPLQLPKEELSDSIIQMLNNLGDYDHNSFKNHDIFLKTQDDSCYYIYMDRFRQKKWFDCYINQIDKKPEKSYLIDINYLPQSVIDSFNQIYESDTAFSDMVRSVSKEKYHPATKEEKQNQLNIERYSKELEKLKQRKIKYDKKDSRLVRVKNIGKIVSAKLKEYKALEKEFQKKFKASLEHYIVTKESQLHLFNLSIESNGITEIRLKPIGVLAQEKVAKGDNFVAAFINSYEDIAIERQDLTKAYLDDIDRFEISFIPHPALKYNTDNEKLFNEVQDGEMVSYIGIVHDIIPRLTKNGKPMYWVMLQTKFDLIRISVWNDGPNKYPDLFDKGNLVMIKGKKGFGGISASDLQVSTPTKKEG